MISMLQKISKTGNVEGLTDHTQYTGMHKEKFDEEGHGTGSDDKTEYTGYVGQYKGAGTYDKKHDNSFP